MAYNKPSPSATQGPPLFDERMNAPQSYPKDDYLLKIQNSWIENLDPLLRSSSQPQFNQGSHLGLQNQQESLQRFMAQPERNFFTAAPNHHHSQVFTHALNMPTAPVSSLPQTFGRRVPSPSPSQGPTSTTSSSARSPDTELDWYNDAQYSPMAQPRDDYLLSSATWHIGQAFPDPWAGAPISQAVPQPQYSCLRQIQGLPDLEPEEVTFDSNEGFSSLGVQVKYAAIELNNRNLKNEGSNRYSYTVDEGTGASIRDQSPLEATGGTQSQIIASFEGDADAEGEEDLEILAVGAISDTEYVPKPARSRKRRSSNNRSLNTTKTGRVTKLAHQKSRNNQLACKLCSQPAFKDAHTLQRHIATSHIRTFACVFSFAGCPSTFANKNEWKRHVSSQHLNLQSWICNLGACAKSKRPKSSSGLAPRGSEFNRKDLFMQHLRRMHAPLHIKKTNKKDKEWEERLRELGKTCIVSNRQPPTRLGCPMARCRTIFEGTGTWDERMEHVGKHLENSATAESGCESVQQDNDPLLVEWALAERIIEVKPGHTGSFRLVIGNGTLVGDDDEDAEGEDE